MIDYLGILVVVIFAILVYRHATDQPEAEVLDLPKRALDRVGRLWDISHQSIRDKRFIRAEKALLAILKIDEKNAAAYNRLGILYAKQKELKDAIDCFEIASSIEPTPSSLHNLGLIYFEAKDYDKAAVAFEQALKLEGDLAARHIAYAKVQEQLGNSKLMVEELEKAVELEPNKEAYTLLYKAYLSAGREDDARSIVRKAKLLNAHTRSGKPTRKRTLHSRRATI